MCPRCDAVFFLLFLPLAFLLYSDLASGSSCGKMRLVTTIVLMGFSVYHIIRTTWLQHKRKHTHTYTCMLESDYYIPSQVTYIFIRSTTTPNLTVPEKNRIKITTNTSHIKSLRRTLLQHIYKCSISYIWSLLSRMQRLVLVWWWWWWWCRFARFSAQTRDNQVFGLFSCLFCFFSYSYFIIVSSLFIYFCVYISCNVFCLVCAVRFVECIYLFDDMIVYIYIY